MGFHKMSIYPTKIYKGTNILWTFYTIGKYPNSVIIPLVSPCQHVQQNDKKWPICAYQAQKDWLVTFHAVYLLSFCLFFLFFRTFNLFNKSISIKKWHFWPHMFSNLYLPHLNGERITIIIADVVMITEPKYKVTFVLLPIFHFPKLNLNTCS